jgi:hypothetical protein
MAISFAAFFSPRTVDAPALRPRCALDFLGCRKRKIDAPASIA